MVPYLPLVAAAGDGAMEGLYVSAPFYLAEGDVSPWVKSFQEKYKKRFGKMPAIQAQSAYVMADIFIQAMKTLGDDITVDRLIAALENISHYEDPFDGPSLSFSKTKHAATDKLVLSQVRDKKWVVVKKDLPY
jgi:branched-chain amino acid transport system substrate-binding protein